jgi:hypothetical protein
MFFEHGIAALSQARRAAGEARCLCASKSSPGTVRYFTNHTFQKAQPSFRALPETAIFGRHLI